MGISTYTLLNFSVSTRMCKQVLLQKKKKIIENGFLLVDKNVTLEISPLEGKINIS